MNNIDEYKIREYINHPFLNGKRWNSYSHRPDDILVTTSYKAGTTWMQTIVANLLYQDGKFPAPISFMGPWLESDVAPLEETIAGLERQSGRRAFKTHLPFDGIPYYETMKYIYVCRDGRDVFMSLWNQHNNYSDNLKLLTTAKARECGLNFPHDYENIHEFWRDWISKSWYDWESDGYPYWSHFHHLQSWWNNRHLENILFVHFVDLLENIENQVRRVASFLDIEIDDNQLPGILERISFNSMKENFTKIMPEANIILKGGGNRFMHKGTNGRWRGVLTEIELDQYQEQVKKTLSEDAAKWLENGGSI